MPTSTNEFLAAFEVINFLLKAISDAIDRSYCSFLYGVQYRNEIIMEYYEYNRPDCFCYLRLRSLFMEKIPNPW